MRVHLKDLAPALSHANLLLTSEAFQNLASIAFPNKIKYRALSFKTISQFLKFSRFSWCTMEQNICSLRAGRHGGEVKIHFPIELNENLGTIVGHILGDGAIDARYQQAFFSNNNAELLQEFINSMCSLFQVEPRIWEHANNQYGNSKWARRLSSIAQKRPGMCLGLFYPSICGRILNCIFHGFAIGKSKSITAPMFTAPINFKKGLIRALFDDEASCDANSYMIRMHQDNKLLLEDLRRMLLEVGVESNPVHAYYHNGKQRCYFTITKKSNFVAFAHYIGFTSSKKQVGLNKLIQPDRRRRASYRSYNKSLMGRSRGEISVY